MPYKGQINNPGGINSFSGPLGQKEPEYGAVERSKVLTAAAPGVPSTNAPQKSQRRAVRGKTGGSSKAAAAPAPAPAPPGPTGQPMEAAGGTLGQAAFWQAVMNDPGATPLTREYAARALGAVAA